MALVAHGAGNSTDSNGFTSPAGDSTGSKVIFVNVTLGANSGGLTDSKSNTWVPCTQGVDAFSGRWAQIFFCINPTVGSGHTFSWSGTANFPALTWQAFDDIITALDVENNNTGAFSSSTTTGNVTPTTDNQLIITGLAYDDSVAATIDSSFTITDTIPHTSFGWTAPAMAYLFETTATAKNPTWSWTNSGQNVAVIATFKRTVASGFIAKGNQSLQAVKRAAFY